MIKDFAYSRTKAVTRKQAVLAFLDAFISGMILVLFLGVTLTVAWLIFGH